MSNIRQLADDIDRERRSRAALLDGGERLVEGLRMWHDSLEWMKAGVRHRHPHAGDPEVIHLVNEQLRRIRRVSESGIYHPVERPVEEMV